VRKGLVKQAKLVQSAILACYIYVSCVIVLYSFVLQVFIWSIGPDQVNVDSRSSGTSNYYHSVESLETART